MNTKPNKNNNPIKIRQEFPFYKTYIDMVNINNENSNVVKIYWYRMNI